MDPSAREAYLDQRLRRAIPSCGRTSIRLLAAHQEAARFSSIRWTCCVGRSRTKSTSPAPIAFASCGGWAPAAWAWSMKCTTALRDEVVALKTLRRTGAADLYRLKREFRSLADVTHPNLVCLYELFVEEERVFFTMELVRGVSFVDYARGTDRASLSTDRLVPALRQLVDGVSALHRRGKLHRDIKPSNVLVTPEGRVVILDFGLIAEVAAARTRASAIRARRNARVHVTRGSVGRDALRGRAIGTASA